MQREYEGNAGGGRGELRDRKKGMLKGCLGSCVILQLSVLVCLPDNKSLMMEKPS